MLKERIEGQLRETTLGLGAEDCVTLCWCQPHECLVLYLLSYLSRASHAQCSQGAIASLSSRRSEYAFEQSYSTAGLENVALSCIFLEDSCKSESLYRSLSSVTRGRLDGDMCRRILVGILDVEESFLVGLTWS